MKVEIAKLAKKYIERGWTQGADFRDSYSQVVSIDDLDITYCCLRGAIRLAARELGCRGTTIIPSEFYDKLKYGIVDFNDTKNRTKEEVIQFLDECIKEWENGT